MRMEARAGLEPAIADLQSAALPLGHRAENVLAVKSIEGELRDGETLEISYEVSLRTDVRTDVQKP